MSYSDLLRDPRWQRKRLEVMQAADFACELCGDRTKTLNVHHKKYKKGRKPWEYDLDQLQCLCEFCHAGLHGKGKVVSVAPAERRVLLVGGPVAGETISTTRMYPLVWVYEKAGVGIFTAEDSWQEITVRGRTIASHLFSRGHPYMYSTMYGPEKHAQFREYWNEEPFPVLRGMYGYVEPGRIEGMATEIRFLDPDMLLLRIDTLYNILNYLEFNEVAYWEEEA